MNSLHYAKAEPIGLKGNSDFTEAWLQDRIIEDPAILGLGDLELKDVQRLQPSGGRLDLMLRDPDSEKRYEIEIMLGATDERHIIRPLEYWDIERKRYPQYDHCAVIVAEDITSRFLNVIGLFNGFIPLIALKLSVLRIGDQVILIFVKVLDELMLGKDDDEIAYAPPADRTYWVEKASEDSVALSEACLNVLHEINPKIALKFNRYYIGLLEDGRINNFVVFRPKREFIRVEVRVDQQDSWRNRLEKAGMMVLQSNGDGVRLKFRLAGKDFDRNQEFLRELFVASYKMQ